jgi:D-beta-D-heptose 7-phosphate kinase/D-beta-D-heptose 1-phosphate adenosyltransferase
MTYPKSEIIVAVSGGFDPLHIGHVEMFAEAKALGDKLIVIVNNDNWLKLKKGYAFMPEKERAGIIEAIRHVDEVRLTEHKANDTDMSVCKELEKLKPTIFANGGDRKPDGVPVPEVQICEKLGIKLVYNVGKSGKIQSSSELVSRALEIKNPKNN